MTWYCNWRQVPDGDDEANELYDSSYSWAAFDNIKMAFGLSGGGNGVAVNLKTSDRT